MRKRARTSLDTTAIVNVWQRELGELSATNFAHRLITSKDFVLRLNLFRKLEKHTGCVNTVSFNSDGDILVSGSDDRKVILWDWEAGDIKLSFNSGHSSNVFQAKFMPYTEDRIIITCAADGQVRYARILENGEVETKMLAKHQGRAYNLATEPGSPHTFYSCGGDGLVQHIDLRTEAATTLFTCKSIRDKISKPFSLNVIAIVTGNSNTIAVAGSDEYVRLYDIRKYKLDSSTDFGQPTDYFCPRHLVGDEQVLVTGLTSSDQGELLASYNDEHIYLFARDMSLGSDPELIEPKCAGPDVKTCPQVYKGHMNCETFKGVSFFGPKCEYVVSGSDCGQMFIWKKKGGELVRVVKADSHVVNCVESHPSITALASCGIGHDIKLWTPQQAFDNDILLSADSNKRTKEATRAIASSPRDLISQLFPSQRQAATSRRSEQQRQHGELQLLDLFDDATFDDNVV